jgi:hypothetical protein
VRRGTPQTWHMQAVLKPQINTMDRNDALGIAQMMRAGLSHPVHVKPLRSQKLRMLLTHRTPIGAFSSPAPMAIRMRAQNASSMSK